MTDIHAHYDDAKFDGDREELLASLSYMKIINAGCDRISSEKARALAEKYENIYFTAGVHPEYAAVCEDFESWLVPLLSHPKCVGIGEIGLDYHYDEPPRDIQKEIFNRQLYLAVKYGKPVVIHDRDAHADSVDAVLAHSGVRGVFHSFSGSAETANPLVTPIRSRLRLRIFARLGTGSLLTSSPRPSSASAIWVLFPPGAAQRSSTRSPGWGESTATAAMALGS